MHSLITKQLYFFVLIYISSAFGLHSISKRFQIPSIDSKNIPQQERPIRDSILDRFHINANTIIRTHDSRALGAKYLNETELPSNEDCLYWCWETSPCNLAVYEQKTRGSCYLFDCGSNEDFRCKFTAHNFYSSSILQVNRHPFDLNQWGSQVQHEKELTKLRVQSTAIPLSSSTTPLIRNLMAPSMVPTTTVNTLMFHKTTHCLHYQFECKNNSECIAIYNVCDGIPQCSDGSDEAMDLECHKSRFNVPNPKPSHLSTQLQNSGQMSTNTQMESKTMAQKPEKSGSIYARIASNKGSQVMPAYNYPKTVDSDNTRPSEDQSVLSKKHSFNPSGDLGTKNSYNPQYRGSWNQYYNQNDDNRQNSAGLGVEPEYMNGYNNRETSLARDNSGSYWPSIGRQQSYDLSDQMLSPGGQTYVNRNPISNKPQTNSDVWSQSGSNNNYDSNYYDRISRTRINKPEVLEHSVPHEIPSNPKLFSNTKQIEIDSNVKTKQNSFIGHKYEQQLKTQSQGKGDSNKAQLYNEPKTSYSHISSSNSVAKSPRIVAVSYMHDSGQQSGRETNSAVIALTLGLCVTALLIVLVGCRMKSFKKKIARRGRSLAHDADYLVNGMYL